MARTAKQKAAAIRNLEKARAAKKRLSGTPASKVVHSDVLKTALTGSREKRLNNFADTLDILARINRRNGNSAGAKKVAGVAMQARKAASKSK